MSHKRTRVIHTNLLATGLSALFYLAVLVVAGCLASVHTQSVQTAAEPVSLVAEDNMEAGTLNQDPEKCQEGLNQVVEGGMPAFSISATPFMKNGISTANLLMGNPSGNGKRFTTAIQRNDTEEVIYQPGYPGPEQYVDDVPLGATLPRGEYPCTVYFDAHRIEDDVCTGEARAEIKPYVSE